MEDIYAKIVELLRKNRSSVLATMIRQAGAAPRHAGTKFLILEDGSFVGTIGGGLLEAQVLEGAKEVLKTHSPLRLNFILKGKDVEKTDMICGGDAEVFLEPVSPENLNHLDIFKKAVDVNRKGGSGVVATIVNEHQWQAEHIPKMFMDPDGERIGSLSGIREAEDALRQEIKQVLTQGEPNIIICHDNEGNELELFVEPLASEPILYVFGGGHVSLQIVPLAARVGFKVVVVDDRAEFADPNNFPEAWKVHEYPFEGVLDKFPVDESSYFVIVTRGHIHDKTVLTQALRTPARYVGMIGSRRKRNMIYDALLKEGFTKDDIDRVHAPIGLDIGAETPEEIAVSIVGELIKVRAGA
ncbi:MAG: XdhC family protein [Desulfobacteraceae bacterium]|jgi:xanthine dehydrogenase accessory factor